jgi:MFS family permease
MRTGAERYRSLLALPGARAPVVASAFGSLPIGMFALGIVLLARDATGSFADAGWVAGAFGLANAIGAMAQGRIMDRIGQPRVLRTAATGHLIAVVALVVAATRDASTALLALIAIAGGACLPQTPAAMRALWGALVHDPERRHTAYALVAIVFELAVVAAPALVALIVALASPAAAVLTAVVLASGSAFAFTATPASQAWRGAPHATGWVGPLAGAGMRTLFFALAAMGTAVGVIQVAVPAYADERGTAELAGVLLAALSAGSLVGGLVYGARSWRGPPVPRLAALLLGLGCGFALLALAGPPAAIAACLLLAGLVLAPAVVVGSALLDVAAPHAVTEGFSVLIMGIVAGNAAGNALGGALVEGASHATAALCAGAVAALGAAYALARRRTLVYAPR